MLSDVSVAGHGGGGSSKRLKRECVMHVLQTYAVVLRLSGDRRTRARRDVGVAQITQGQNQSSSRTLL